MKYSYEYTKEDLKKYLFKSRIKSNIILFIIGIVIYLIFGLKKYAISYFAIYIISLLVLILLLNKLYIFLYLKVNLMMNNIIYGKYTLEINNNNFSLTLNKVKTTYKYKEVRKIIEKKDCFILKLNNLRDNITFEKKLFKEDDYQTILKALKKNIK